MFVGATLQDRRINRIARMKHSDLGEQLPEFANVARPRFKVDPFV